MVYDELRGNKVYMNSLAERDGDSLSLARAFSHEITDSYFVVPRNRRFERVSFLYAFDRMDPNEILLNLDIRNDNSYDSSCVIQGFGKIKSFLGEFNTNPDSLESIIGEEIALYMRKNELLGIGVPQRRYE